MSPFLAMLGASGIIVGFAAGFGELVGYVMSLPSGYIADRTGRYCVVIITGYVINMLALPLMALAGSWQVAILLLIIERAGKAIRNPARDAMLFHATMEMGRGWGFGIHEAMDQIGAMLGPLIVAVLMSAFFAPLVFLGDFYASLIGMILRGVGMGGRSL